MVDANKAKILNDKRVKPYLIDEKNDLALPVPTVENVGQCARGGEGVRARYLSAETHHEGGQVRRLWVDTQTFLETKIEGVR